MRGDKIKCLRGLSKTAVVPFHFAAWPLHDCAAPSIAHVSKGSYIDAVCVLKVTLCVPELIASHFDVDWVLTAACAC